MKGKNTISKREMTRADQCKILQYTSIAYDTAGNVAADVSSIEGVNLVAAPIAAGSHLSKGLTDAAMVAMDCSSIPFEEIKQILDKRFNEINRKLDKGAEALESVSKLVDKTYRTVEKVRFEMREGFKRVIETIENAATKQIISDINEIVQYFSDEKENINNRRKEDYVAKLEEPAPGNFLLYLRKSRTSEEGSLHSLLFKIINQESAIPLKVSDDNAIRALYALFYGTQTYISIMLYLVKQYSYLADYYYQKGNLVKFNDNFIHMKTVFQDFKFSLIGIRGQSGNPLMDTVIGILDAVKSKSFIRNLRNNLYQDILKQTETLLRLKTEIASMELPVIEDTPKSSSFIISFRERSPSVVQVQTPILKWNPGTVVKYAVQYEQDGKYSRISSWSNPITIQELASPFITIDKDVRNRLIFRQFGEETPELVAILNGSENEFRDIHRDLYNAAQMLIRENSLTTCQQLINSGADVTASFEMGRKAIHAAASVGHDNVASLLLENDSELLNASDKNGYTPLHVASEFKKNDFVEILLGKGANVNAQTNLNLLTPLHLAARRDFTIIVRTLAGKGDIDLNAKEHAGFTPLHVSITSNFRAARTLVRETNADINIKSNFGLTPLHLAVLQNNLNAAQILAKSDKGINLNEADDNGMTPLHYAAMTGSLTLTIFLMAQPGIDYNAKTSRKNWTPLHLAILFKKFEVAERLLMESNLDVSIKAEDEITTLHLAAATGNKQLIEDILGRGVDIDIKTMKGLTALHLAIMNKNGEIPPFLIGKGATVNAKTNFGATPLHLAAALGKVNIFKTLISNEANIREQDINQQMPIHEAVSNGHLEIVQILIEKDSSLMNAKNIRQEYPFYLAAEKRYKDVFNYLESKGANVNEKDEEGNTLLLLFSTTGELEVVQFLIQNGADFRHRNNKGKNFFDFAVENGHANIVTFAVEENKVDLHEEYRGKNILYHALCDAVKYDSFEVVKYFVETMDELVCSPLQEAAAFAHFDLVKYFVQERGINPNAFNEENEISPLCLAVHGNVCGVQPSCDTPERLEVVKYLAGKTTDLNRECDLQKLTPILHAVYGNKVNILNYLVQAGADPNRKVSRDPPVYTAAMIGHYEIVKSFIENHGVDVNVRNDEEMFTPLHAAARNDHIDVVKYLVSKGADVNAVGIENVKPIDLAGDKSREYLQSLGKRLFLRNNPHKSHAIENSNNFIPINSISGKMSHEFTFRERLSPNRPRREYDFNTAEDNGHSENIHIRSVDVNGALMLLDLMVRVFTNQKLNYAASGSGLNTRSTDETQAEALKITEKFEGLLNVLSKGESYESIDFSKVHSKIYKSLISDNKSKISEMLCSYVEEYSKLNSGEIEKILAVFKPLISAVSSKFQADENLSNVLLKTCGLSTNSNVLQIK